MSIRLLLACASTVAFATVSAQEKAVYPAPAKPLSAEYTIYAGSLGDEQAPTKDDRKLAIEVTGKAAKEIFDSLYPDVQGVSWVWCAYSPNGGYRCFLGFNLRTGESISGGSC
jgi:hypothetical protein